MTLDEVLVVGSDEGASGDDFAIGEPLVAGASVSARVEAQDRGPRLDMLKYKSKTRQRTRRGHRQRRTQLTVTAIVRG